MKASATILSLGWRSVKIRSGVRYSLDHWIATPGCTCMVCQFRRKRPN